MSLEEKQEISFRPMTEADIDDVLQIESKAHVAPWTRGIFEDCIRVKYYCPLLVAEDEIFAYAVMSVVAGEAHIFNVCVSVSHQGQGFGRKIVRHLLDVAKQNKATTAFLEVRPSNKVAIQLYESLGFLEVGQRKNYYPAESGRREDALIMAIELVSTE